jgi:hypothetical protein
VGTLAARIGKGGKTETDGRFIASSVMAVSLLAVAFEVAALLLARTFAGHSPMDANVELALAPVVALAGSIFGIRMVFPLSQLGSVKTAWDLFLFLLALLAIGYFFKKFYGWGIFFVGGFTQLSVVLAVAVFFIVRLTRRALGLSRPSTANSENVPMKG